MEDSSPDARKRTEYFHPTHHPELRTTERPSNLCFIRGYTRGFLEPPSGQILVCPNAPFKSEYFTLAVGSPAPVLKQLLSSPTPLHCSRLSHRSPKMRSQGFTFLFSETVTLKNNCSYHHASTVLFSSLGTSFSQWASTYWVSPQQLSSGGSHLTSSYQ